MPLDDLVNEIYRKIGRNMLLFQQLEYYLKYIVANASICGYVSELAEKQAEHISCVNKKTMGTLVGLYVEHINPDYVNKTSEPEDLTKPYISFNIRLKFDREFYETKKEDLANLVSERNALIHNLLPEFTKNSEENCRMLEEKLDKQCEKIRSEIKQIESIARVFKEERKKWADSFKSEKGDRYFDLLFLRSSLVVFLLADIADREKRPDGWTVMNRAANRLYKDVPEEFAATKKEHGIKTLKSLMLVTGLFDISEEKTEKGGTRVLYRLNKNCEITG